MAVWKGHSFNTISGREAEKFSGKDSGKGDSDFNDSDSDISGDALKKDLINHMQSGEGSSSQPKAASFPTVPFGPATLGSQAPSVSSPQFFTHPFCSEFSKRQGQAVSSPEHSTTPAAQAEAESMLLAVQGGKSTFFFKQTGPAS